MTYVEKNLRPEEEIVCQIKPHWIIFLRTFFWLTVTLLVLFFGMGSVIGQMQPIKDAPPLYQIIAIITFCAALFAALHAFMKYASSEFAVTNKRVVMKSGVIKRRTTEILLARIESISIYQSLLGRLCNYGSLTISGTGGSKDPFMNLPNPLSLRDMIQNSTEKDLSQ